MITQILSRRSFSKLVGVSAAIAALESLPLADSVASVTAPSPTPVRLSSNENPYGPSPAALKAMTEGFNLLWRYPDEYGDLLATDLAQQHNVPVNQILLGDGSSEILKICASAYTGKGKKLVIANPTFGAIARHAEIANAEVVRINLTNDYRLDLQRMLWTANGNPEGTKNVTAKSADLVYICNPNNPTATVSNKDQLAAFIAKVSRGTMVLVDEAYHHYVESNYYESVIPFVKDHPNLIVVRTFSKIYGMAGLRLGYCITQPENIKLMKAHQVFDSVNIMAIVAALASLKDRDHVARARESNSQVRKSVCDELDALGYRYIPSDANFMMIDLSSRCGSGRKCEPGSTAEVVIAAMLKRGVEVGRFFPAMPNFMRVSIGTSSQMKAFLSAFKEVMA